MVDHLTFFGGVGGYGLFSLGKYFFPKPLELEIFSATDNGVRCIFSIICHEQYFFFQCRILFFPSISLQTFFPQNESAGYFFLKSPIIPSKVKWLTPKIHQTFVQLTDSDLSIISKAF